MNCSKQFVGGGDKNKDQRCVLGTMRKKQHDLEHRQFTQI